MNQRILIQFGRAGDVLNLLPIAYAAHLRGERMAIMVFEEFKGILDGCSYVDEIVVPGSMKGTVNEVDNAIAHAKTLTDNYAVTLLYNGPDGPVKQTEESFQKQAWAAAGEMKLWRDQPPLVFDKRSPERESVLLAGLTKKRKFILTALGGTSSPFPYGGLVKELLRLKFKKQFDVIDISEFKCEKIYDLLALYDRAHCLVATDSAPLHLAYAVKNLPVCALVNDRPSLWHGSCWRPNHIFHARYRDYPLRAVEMLEAIEGIGEHGSMFPVAPESPKTVHVWSKYEITNANEKRHEAAKATWQNDYRRGFTVSCPVEIGSVGRDSRYSSMRDDKRFPYVKDVIRLAMLRANDNDEIALTRCDTCLDGLDKVFRSEKPWYSHRMITKNGQKEFHTAVDVFAFTKKWWREHQNEYPDMLMGNDPYWHRVLLELFKKHGAVEVPFACYREDGK